MPSEPTTERYARALSPLERVWLVAHRLYPPFASQLVCEGEGVLDMERWRAAVASASEANPGARARLRGALSSCRWVDTGDNPPVRAVDGSSWSGMGPEGAPFLEDRLHPTLGPTSEVLLVNGETPRVVFRGLHALMDGRGIQHWIQDVFRCLRDEAPLGSSSTITDLELSREVLDMQIPLFPEDSLSPTGPPDGRERGLVWRRLKLAGRHSRLLPRVASLLAAEAHNRGAGKVRIGVPVDLRRHRSGLRSTGNLTGLVYVPVEAGEDPSSFDSKLRAQLDERREALRIGKLGVLQHIPLWVMKSRGRDARIRTRKRGLYPSSATVTTLGRLDLNDFSGGGFMARSIFSPPPGAENLPCLVTLTGSIEHVDLVACMPRNLASQGRLEGILALLQGEFSA